MFISLSVLMNHLSMSVISDNSFSYLRFNYINVGDKFVVVDLMDSVLIPQPSDVTKIKGYYIIEGYKFPRVTSIIKVINKPALLRWYGTLGTAKAEEYTNERADFGTQLHKNIESLVQLEDSEIDVDEIL